LNPSIYKWAPTLDEQMITLAPLTINPGFYFFFFLFNSSFTYKKKERKGKKEKEEGEITKDRVSGVLGDLVLSCITD
jgi:hypothetical protein